MKNSTLLLALPIAILIALFAIGVHRAAAQTKDSPSDRSENKDNKSSSKNESSKKSDDKKSSGSKSKSKKSAKDTDKADATPIYRDPMASLTVFVLAIFIGFELITKVPPTLHTPLMSGSNAISGITIVGAVLVAGSSIGGVSSFLGFLAVVLASVNVVGGFMVTHRMLSMFQKR